VLTVLQTIELGQTPPEIAHRVHRVVREEVAADDPYRDAKALGTQQALSLYPRLKALVAASDDPLGVAMRLSIAGNIMDLGVEEQHENLWRVVERVLDQPLAVDDVPALRAALEEAAHVLFLADNAGETVFDRVLVEALSVPVFYAVKGAPTLNDATLADAVAAGLDGCATLISNGTDAPGTILPLCSGEFRRRYEDAPLIIAKGQANYETLSREGPKVFCMLQIKCPVIARDVGTPVGSIVVRRSN
jgi:uncharacterized protein with ATP-grasp and redox domains